LTRNPYSLRAPISEAAYGAARPFPAAARADFALVADRSAPKKAPPPNFALFASAAAPAGATPAGYALVADTRAIIANPWSKRALYVAIAIAFLLHLAVLAPFVLRLAPGLSEPARELGMEDGAPEHLNVSVISEADLKRLSSDPFRQEAPPSPAPAETPAPPPEPEAAPEPTPKPPVKEASAASSPTQPDAPDNKSLPFDPAGYITKMSEQFSFQLKQSVKAAEERRDQARQASRQSGNVNSFRPGATHQGKSDEWERKVIWALAATKPMGNGKWGSAVVTFAVSDGGQVQGLRLIKSSGDNWLDEGALLAVKQARMPAPPPGLPSGDRVFNIEYISLPDH
jgi:periplasmic protein TonB